MLQRILVVSDIYCKLDQDDMFFSIVPNTNLVTNTNTKKLKKRERKQRKRQYNIQEGAPSYVMVLCYSQYHHYITYDDNKKNLCEVYQL